jgi:hypothetical protein
MVQAAHGCIHRDAETILSESEVVRKQSGPSLSWLRQRGTVMLIAIINLIYREFLKASLSGAKAAKAF